MALSCLTSSAQGHHLLEKHDLFCNEAFPCPTALTPRVEFWVDVFHKFTRKDLVLHDRDQPNRIYSVIKSERPCTRRREPRVVRREKKRLERLFKRVASKAEAGQTVFSGDEHHIYEIFRQETPREIRNAIENIRCQVGNRDRFEDALVRYMQYQQEIEHKLQEAKLPKDIQYLPFVESLYNPLAYSRVGAAGLWQLMPRTARKFGLKITGAVDERFDPSRATDGAIQYFLKAYDTFDRTSRNVSPNIDRPISPFVITSYNYGIAGMRKAMRRKGTDFVHVLETYRGRRFRTAVKNFYASFLAARHVALNAKKYFGDVIAEQQVALNQVKLPQSISAETLSEQTGYPAEELRKWNPSLTRRVWNGTRLIPKGYSFSYPKGTESHVALLTRLAKLPKEELGLRSDTYRVERGDTVWGIAKLFNVSRREIINANDLNRRGKIRVGELLVIPQKKTRIVQAKTRKGPSISALRPEKRALPKVVEKEFNPRTEFRDIAATFGIAEDLLVKEVKTGNTSNYWITVEAEESLDSYAEWLGLETTRSLMEWNGLKSKVGNFDWNTAALTHRDVKRS